MDIYVYRLIYVDASPTSKSMTRACRPGLLAHVVRPARGPYIYIYIYIYMYEDTGHLLARGNFVVVGLISAVAKLASSIEVTQASSFNLAHSI